MQQALPQQLIRSPALCHITELFSNQILFTSSHTTPKHSFIFTVVNTRFQPPVRYSNSGASCINTGHSNQVLTLSGKRTSSFPRYSSSGTGALRSPTITQ